MDSQIEEMTFANHYTFSSKSTNVTQRLADLTGTFGNDWQLLTAGAFVTMILPLIVFFALQRYFVRGMMAGSVKG